MLTTRHDRERADRIPRMVAHVQIVKYQSGYRLEKVEIRYVHGSKKPIEQALARLGYNVPNTLAIERRNGTVWLMSGLRCAKLWPLLVKAKPRGNGLVGMTVYNWYHEHRSLSRLLPVPVGKKVSTAITGYGYRFS